MTNTETAAPTLTIRRTFQAPRERVFAAFTTPEILREWHGPPETAIESVAFDARPGGRYRIEMRMTDGEAYNVGGVISEFQPPELLAYSFRWEEDDPQLERDDPPQLVLAHVDWKAFGIPRTANTFHFRGEQLHRRPRVVLGEAASGMHGDVVPGRNGRVRFFVPRRRYVGVRAKEGDCRRRVRKNRFDVRVRPRDVTDYPEIVTIRLRDHRQMRDARILAIAGHEHRERVLVDRAEDPPKVVDFKARRNVHVTAAASTGSPPYAPLPHR